MPNSSTPVPRGNAEGFVTYIKNDIVSGFLVFLIALPLCLGISIASGFPPVAGIFTAIVGAIVTTFISNSELTIKGPAAGLIVIILGCVEAFGGNGMAEGWSEIDATAYRSALAVGVAAAVLQILFGVFRAGILGEFFPTAAVHGMLAAIGAIIMIKQFPVALGVSASGSPFKMLAHFGQYIQEANPAIAMIGLVGLAIMFLWPSVRKNVKFLKPIPAPVVVLLVTIPMGIAFDLLHEHSYTFMGNSYDLSEQYLVKMPDQVFKSITTPDFTALTRPVAWKWVLMFFIIGSLESLLSAKAVDLLDPYKRKSNMDRDIIAVGVANLGAAFVGGLPMISEIVRSKANIDNGAKTRFADMWHGMFLLVCVALFPAYLHRIPMAALAAMLVYTGSRLAHPTEFIHVYRIGKEQLAIFVTTMIVVLATDLLIGVAAGIILKMILHVANGVPLKSLFKPFIEVQEVDETTSMIVASESAVFSNWIPFKRQIEDIGLVQKRNLIVDISNTTLVDHSVMEKLEEVRDDFEQEGLKFEIRGLDTLQPVSSNFLATRRRGLASVRRLTIVADASLEDTLEAGIVNCGASGYNTIPCQGAGRHDLERGHDTKSACIRIEVVATHRVADAILVWLQNEILATHNVTACIETVDVVRATDFAAKSEVLASH
ncbi:MAG: SulP family inorganic anion transporter [Planctomycetaceae bacterium]|nr:SulP family inorganic anion transporter [Planctomycetaceae bacterium]